MVTFSDAEVLSWLYAVLLPFFRIVALMSSAPILSARSVPVRLRVVLSMMIALLVVPTLPAAQVQPSSFPGLLLVLQQVLIGLSIGFAARLIFAAFEVAGEVIGLQMGLSYAGFFDPQAGAANAVGRTFSTLALLTFVTMNGPLLLIGAVHQSFALIPIDLASQAAPSSFHPWSIEAMLSMGANIFASALSLALPIVVMLLFLNLVLGVVSRVAPQFNIFAIGFPVTLTGGLLLLAAGLPFIERPMAALTQDFLRLMQMR